VRYKCTLSVAKTLLTLTAEQGAFAEYEILVNWKNCPYSVRSIRCVKGRIGDRSKLGESCDYVVPGLSHPQGRCCMHRLCATPALRSAHVGQHPERAFHPSLFPSTSGHQPELLASSTFLPHESNGCFGSDDAVFLSAAAH
jgi:hypothetical protein